RALFRSGMSASGILSLPEEDGIDEGNGNDEIESPSDFSSSLSFSSGSISGSDSVMYPGDSAVGDTGA
nr:hypothetical protein [Tanacetum cinerariifolium]